MSNTMSAMCFTGHRPKDLMGYDIEKYRDISHACEKAIRHAIEHDGIDTVITGGAQGVDQLAFWAARRAQLAGLPIRNVVYVPFKGQEGRWPEQTPFGQAEYRLMLETADEVVVLAERAGDNYAKLLFARNHAMVDASKLVVAVYHGPADGRVRGGTAETYRYARTHDKKVVVIDPFGALEQAPANMPIRPSDLV